jgi:hypothetical protein
MICIESVDAGSILFMELLWCFCYVRLTAYTLDVSNLYCIPDVLARR